MLSARWKHVFKPTKTNGTKRHLGPWLQGSVRAGHPTPHNPTAVAPALQFSFKDVANAISLLLTDGWHFCNWFFLFRNTFHWKLRFCTAAINRKLRTLKIKQELRVWNVATVIFLFFFLPCSLSVSASASSLHSQLSRPEHCKPVPPTWDMPSKSHLGERLGSSAFAQEIFLSAHMLVRGKTESMDPTFPSIRLNATRDLPHK